MGKVFAGLLCGFFFVVVSTACTSPATPTFTAALSATRPIQTLPVPAPSNTPIPPKKTSTLTQAPAPIPSPLPAETQTATKTVRLTPSNMGVVTPIPEPMTKDEISLYCPLFTGATHEVELPYQLRLVEFHEGNTLEQFAWALSSCAGDPIHVGRSQLLAQGGVLTDGSIEPGAYELLLKKPLPQNPSPEGPFLVKITGPFPNATPGFGLLHTFSAFPNGVIEIGPTDAMEVGGSRTTVIFGIEGMLLSKASFQADVMVSSDSNINQQWATVMLDLHGLGSRGSWYAQIGYQYRSGSLDIICNLYSYSHDAPRHWVDVPDPVWLDEWHTFKIEVANEGEWGHSFRLFLDGNEVCYYSPPAGWDGNNRWRIINRSVDIYPSFSPLVVYIDNFYGFNDYPAPINCSNCDP